MKNLFPVAVLAMLMLTVACKGVDKELVGKMEKDLSTLESLAPLFEKITKNQENLNTQLSAVPEAMKGESNSEYYNLFNMNTMIASKLQATKAEYDDLSLKLKTLTTDYSAGKVKTEDAVKEFETLSRSVEGFSTLLNQISTVGDQLQADYAKMSATWNAKTEEATQ